MRQRIRKAYRGLTARSRVLPDFLIVGAMKSGTTSLYHYLAQHPRVEAAAKKEVDFFGQQYALGLDWYRSHFPTERRVRRGGGQPCITGEASIASLVFSRHAAEQIRRELPDIKLVALLRNPITRAQSHYAWECRHDREPRTFEDAVVAEMKVARGGYPDSVHLPDPVDRHSMVDRYLFAGLYADRLEPFWERFPGERLLVVEAERLFQNPEDTLVEVERFLGLEPQGLDSYGIWKEGSYPEMDAGIRAELASFFAPHNDRLFDRLGRRFAWS